MKIKFFFPIIFYFFFFFFLFFKLQKLLQYIFEPIDKTQIPTGFLEEYGCPMLPMETFNGTLTDSNRIDMHLWRTLYFLSI